MSSFHLLTLFPELLDSAFDGSAGLLGKAVASGVISVKARDLRAHGVGSNKRLDEDPYGGGGGMLMRVDAWASAIKAVRDDVPGVHVVLLTPDAQPLTQARVRRLAEHKAIALGCPRYEGIDDRVRAYVDEEISVGDFILSGGEYAALCVIDAIARLQPGFMGNHTSPLDESYGHPGRLEHAQYTRPLSFEGREVPPVLSSGNHKGIRAYRLGSQIARTLERRPDLLQRYPLSNEEIEALRAYVHKQAAPNA